MSEIKADDKNPLDELKRLAARVLQLGAAPFYSVETYEALQPLHVAFTDALAHIREGCSEEVLDELDRLCRLKNSMSKRKYKGTGSVDTSEETWEQMRAAAIAGEPLRSVAARFGVLYTATISRAGHDKLNGKPWREPPATSNVVQLFRRASTP